MKEITFIPLDFTTERITERGRALLDRTRDRREQLGLQLHAAADGDGTIVEDRVRYELPLYAHPASGWVASQLARAFAYRHERLAHGLRERGHRFLFVCYDNEAYMNTGVQRSSATPPAARTATTPALGPEPGNVFGTGKSVPKIAIAPLFVVWFGFGIIPKVISAFLLGFFPVVVSAVQGRDSVVRRISEQVWAAGVHGRGRLGRRSYRQPEAVRR